MIMQRSIWLCAGLVAVMASVTSGQTPGPNRPLTRNDARVMQLIGDSYDDIMGAAGSIYLYMMTKEPGLEGKYSARMNQAGKTLLELQKNLLLERPNSRDLHQAVKTVISSQTAMQTGAQSLLVSLNKTKANDIPQKVAIFSARVNYFAHSFESFAKVLLNCLVSTYGTGNNDLKTARAVANLQWDNVDCIALAHQFLHSGDRTAAVHFDNKLADFDGQIAVLRASRNMQLPGRENSVSILEAVSQKKNIFANRAHALFKAKEMRQGIDPEMLTGLRADISALTKALRALVDVMYQKDGGTQAPSSAL